MEKINKSKVILLYLAFAILMIGLGTNDALRGIFSPIFKTHFELNTVKVSWIMVVSYAGNLVFLWIGTRLADRYDKKLVMCSVIILWMCALLLYVLTDNYYILLAAMFITMGASTFMNTMMNIFVPAYFAAPGLIVNTLFFVQGIGTTGSQALIGSVADGFGWWHIVNSVLIVIGAAGLVLFVISVGNPFKRSEKNSAKSSKAASSQKVKHENYWKNPVLWLLILIFGFYFIGEHGILNWLTTYCESDYNMKLKDASLYLSLFSGTMMAGRLVIAPRVNKMGPGKSIKLFGGIGTVLYVIGVAAGKSALLVLGISGLFISIVYPTLLLLIQEYFDREIVSTVTGTIISIATIFDIAFNMIFGVVSDKVGFRISFLILPIALVCFYLIFLMLTGKYKALYSMAQKK